MVTSKKGLVRTLEAVIAVMAILGFVYFLFPDETPTTGGVPAEIQAAQEYVLAEISLKEEFRDCIVRGSETYEGACNFGCLTDVESFVKAQAPFGFEGTCEICNSALSCSDTILPPEKSVYTDSIFIARHPVKKVLRIYFYEK